MRPLSGCPATRVLASGDFVIWVFPNAGNPRKVQRYTAALGRRLRRMEQLRPQVLIPGHGPVIVRRGAGRAGAARRRGGARASDSAKRSRC